MVTIDVSKDKEESMLAEFLHNFLHNLFKPLLLFFYFGFLLRILKVDFEFPYVIYQGLTMYLLVAIGWHGGEELADISSSSIGHIVGFMITGFVLNFVIGVIAYLLLSRMTRLRRVDKATVAGYYGSDSALKVCSNNWRRNPASTRCICPKAARRKSCRRTLSWARGQPDSDIKERRMSDENATCGNQRLHRDRPRRAGVRRSGRRHW
jgi:Na+-dependent bicarbonate transporter superfamily